ncbi:MAG: TIGR00153 family protein [Pseudomonadota bacterium]|nr:TIGR00153 family protein [Pseudomonadota bacterium]
MFNLSGLMLKVFARSPVDIVSSHMNVSCSCVSLLPDFFHHAFAGDWSAALLVKQNINDLESQADAKKKQVYLDLHSNLMLPVSRQDVLSLVEAQDSIANQTQDIAGIVYGRRMTFPEEMRQSIDALVCSSIIVCQQAAQVVDELELALQNSFAKQSRKLIEKKVEQLDAYEHDNDMKQIELREMLWRAEASMRAVDVVFLYDIFHRLGNLADNAHRVGSKLLLLMNR